MASNLVQLSFKPGIQRDGTSFQGDQCQNGQWVRFQRGKPKKIGGMIAAVDTIDDSLQNLILVSGMLLLPTNNNQILYYIPNALGIVSGTIDTTTFGFLTSHNLIAGFDNYQAIWQTETIIKIPAPVNGVAQAPQQLVVFLATNNITGIAQNTASQLFYGDTATPNVPLTQVDINLAGIEPLINGGMCFSNPYLFLYGSNGLVQYSTNTDPLNFNTNAVDPADDEFVTAGSFAISNDKVIYGHPIRGGTNSPAILFWTLSSVVRIYNTGTNAVEFQKDVLSTSTSILSSRCVVEYDGLFFWVGTDRFFVFNGIVDELPNNTNLNYFFDNIDMNYRQSVFGVKNTKYGEIWWFYPEKEGTPGRPNVNPGVNTRALIYNKRENNWYDTAISRTDGIFSDDLGFLVTYGLGLVNPGSTYLWRHEFGVAQVVTQTISPIPSSFTTPIFGWSCFNPVNSIYNSSRGQPVDRWIDLKRLEPNFILAPTDQMTLTVNVQTYSASPVISTDAIPFYGNTEKLDLRVQGRQMSLTFASTANFEMGNNMLLFGIGDGQ